MEDGNWSDSYRQVNTSMEREWRGRGRFVLITAGASRIKMEMLLFVEAADHSSGRSCCYRWQAAVFVGVRRKERVR